MRFERRFVDPTSLCWDGEQVISPNLSAVMLSPSAFIDSGQYAVTLETKDYVDK